MSDNMAFGPLFDEKLDGAAIRGQMETIRQFMLSSDDWYTLAELGAALGYPEGSISANLRHLKKEEFGSYDMQKRRRESIRTWEYWLGPPVAVVGRLPF